MSRFIGKSPELPAQVDRYHLYVSFSSPECQSILLALSYLKIPLRFSVLFPSQSSDLDFCPYLKNTQNGRSVELKDCTVDHVFGKERLSEVYQECGSDDQGLITVPLLVDIYRNEVVSNSWKDILRMIPALAGDDSPNIPLYPADQSQEIDELNNMIERDLYMKIHRLHDTSEQDVYDSAYETFFDSLAIIDRKLVRSKFLFGRHLTESDLYLFPILYRLDPVFHCRYKLNKRHLYEYPCLWRWMTTMMKTVDERFTTKEYLHHCKLGFFEDGIVPRGPPGYPEIYHEQHWLYSGTTPMYG